MTKLKLINLRIYCCNCGDLFNSRKALVVHIQNKKKGKHKDIHYGGDGTGNQIGLVKFIWKI